MNEFLRCLYGVAGSEKGGSTGNHCKKNDALTQSMLAGSLTRWPVHVLLAQLQTAHASTSARGIHSENCCGSISALGKAHKKQTGRQEEGWPVFAVFAFGERNIHYDTVGW